jgi:predicted MPP superfamily phosphohydrolase
MEYLMSYLEKHSDLTSQERDGLAVLEPRLGISYIRQRLDLEASHEALALRQRRQFFSGEGLLSSPSLIRGCLWLLGLQERARRNALAIEVRHHTVHIPHLPDVFEGFLLLHLSDLHFGMNDQFLDTLVQRLEPLCYDLCVLTGDYRALTFGQYEVALDGLKRLQPFFKSPSYAILGNHDTIRMVPVMESLGYRLLLNESTMVSRGNDFIYLAGIDDAGFYHMDNLHRAANDIPPGAVSILLSHTPETYHHAACAAFDLMLCGHTHGGQICLPGGIPIRTEAASPRRLARGSWRYRSMIGYTSAGAGTCIVDARLNCPPEITLHRLLCRPTPRSSSAGE